MNFLAAAFTPLDWHTEAGLPPSIAQTAADRLLETPSTACEVELNRVSEGRRDRRHRLTLHHRRLVAGA